MGNTAMRSCWYMGIISCTVWLAGDCRSLQMEWVCWAVM